MADVETYTGQTSMKHPSLILFFGLMLGAFKKLNDSIFFISYFYIVEVKMGFVIKAGLPNVNKFYRIGCKLNNFLHLFDRYVCIISYKPEIILGLD